MTLFYVAYLPSDLDLTRESIIGRQMAAAENDCSSCRRDSDIFIKLID